LSGGRAMKERENEPHWGKRNRSVALLRSSLQGAF
jgi:hypothetical protein